MIVRGGYPSNLVCEKSRRIRYANITHLTKSRNIPKYSRLRYNLIKLHKNIKKNTEWPDNKCTNNSPWSQTHGGPAHEVKCINVSTWEIGVSTRRTNLLWPVLLASQFFHPAGKSRWLPGHLEWIRGLRTVVKSVCDWEFSLQIKSEIMNND